MKIEVYSCLKMLGALRDSCITIYNTNNHDSARALCVQYDSIRDTLSKHLQPSDIDNIPTTTFNASMFPTESLHEILSACKISIAYLNSMEGSKEKELKEKERQLKMKETELEVGIKHNEELRKVYEKSIEAISMLPEVQRSRAVAEMKKAHRDIEKNTRKPSVIAALTDKKD